MLLYGGGGADTDDCCISIFRCIVSCLLQKSSSGGSVSMRCHLRS
jgi:hypothetical protein